MRKPIQVLVYPVRYRKGEWEYLLLHRIPSRGGFWQGVSGGVEEGEDINTTARRELIEETKLIPLRLERIDYFYSFLIEDKWRDLYPPDTKRIIEYVFVAHIAANQKPIIDPFEHDQCKWCSFDEALKLLTWQENKTALARCNDIITAKRQCK
ncbi:MAG: NUDIX pyrophosphatase [candidate division WOR-3 bacterium]